MLASGPCHIFISFWSVEGAIILLWLSSFNQNCCLIFDLICGGVDTKHEINLKLETEALGSFFQLMELCQSKESASGNLEAKIIQVRAH